MLLLVGALEGAAAAQVTAREHYERGTTLYDLRRYDEAAREYEAAFELKQDPALLFNIGQAYRGAREYEKSVLAYRSFLRRLPTSSNRSEVESRIAEMERLIAEQRKTLQSPPAGTLAPKETPAPSPQPTAGVEPRAPEPRSDARPPSRRLQWAGIGVASAGVALLAVGGALLGLSYSAAQEINQPKPGYVFQPDTERRFNTEQPLGIAFLTIGGVAAVGGATLALLGWSRARGGR
jgi:tetratricopeptide (TPR) repeat protein